MDRLTETENWLFKRTWWGLISLVLVLTLSFQALFFLLQYRDNTHQLEAFQNKLFQQEFSDLQSHLERELNQIQQSLKANQFDPKQAIERLRSQRFGLEDRGYFFVLQLHDIDGGPEFAEHLLLPIDPSQEGVLMDSGLQDERGFAYRDQYLSQLRETGQAQVSYWYSKPGTDYSSEKTSYIHLIPELSWVLGAGLYLDDFAVLVAQYHANQQGRLISSAMWSLSVSFVLVLLALLVMRYHNRQSMSRLHKLHQQVSDFQSQMVSYSHRLQVDVERKARQLEKMYQVDTLTQVLNRYKLKQDIADLCKNEAVLMVNIDGFKEINEVFGNEIGDVILCELAYKLKKRFVEDRVYRLNSDVFVVIFTPDLNEDVLILLNELHHHIVRDRLPQFNDHDVDFNVTIVGTQEHENTLGRLEMTMLHAKFKRVNTLCYSPDLDYSAQYRSNLSISHEIRTAIDQDRVVPMFQAIRNLHTNRVTHYECLMRIADDDGYRTPANFLHVAQRSKLYPELVRIMLQKSFAAFEDSELNFSINLSYEDIISDDIRHTIIGLLNENNAGRVIFEILESEGIENYPEVSHFISEVKARGCKIAIDDFGTGYSNFEHLLKLNVDYIKLDGTLVEGLLENKEAQYVVESVVYFAKNVGIKVIAEFVSQPALIEMVKNLGIDYAQGYAIGYPSVDLLPDDES
ncbi:MAG: EAL domain-containing protein [Thiomicrospira sp.]|uniref:EAL domain-containing protein n=1 Tax=Thiomicrospira sp. TaxID=935 RepID=UPI0019E61358|nr:EAL domain-containing protein [Thiomicrospira sp.]MBE0494345.1 EAL domain-containing protein [Thiomicrospira sp.]